MARLERLNNFGSDGSEESREDHIIRSRELIIAESVAQKQGLADLRNQIGSWKSDFHEENAEERVLSADIAVDETDYDLLDRLRSDIASFKGEDEYEAGEPGLEDGDGLSELRDNLTGLFGKPLTDVDATQNEPFEQGADLRSDEPYLKEDQTLQVDPNRAAEPITSDDQPVAISGADNQQDTELTDLVEVQSSLPGDQHLHKDATKDRMNRFVAKSGQDSSHKAQENHSSAVEQNEVLDLLAELRGDIVALKESQEQPASDDSGELRSLVAELKGEISALKEEKSQSTGADSGELHSLLAELKSDISALKEEQSQPQVTEADEILGLFAELKSDISTLKEEQNQPLVPEVDEILGLFAELKSDISTLKEEQNQPLVPEVDEILGLFAELKSDISTLKEEQSQPIVPEADEIRSLFAELKGDISVLKKTAGNLIKYG